MKYRFLGLGLAGLAACAGSAPPPAAPAERTVTSVTAGNGLSGGAITASGTINANYARSFMLGGM